MTPAQDTANAVVYLAMSGTPVESPETLISVKADLYRFDLELAPEGTDFQKQVWHDLLDIPAGETRTYSEIARRLGRQLVMAIKINEPAECEYWEEVLLPLIASDPTVDVVPNPKHEPKADLMARAAAAIVPIRWAEPFGLVMAEANACGTPVVALFGPTAPNRTGPYGQQHEVIQSGVQCSPCFKRRCRSQVVEEFGCMKRIEVDQVREAVTRKLSRRVQSAFGIAQD